MNDFKIGKGLWKFNNSLLHDIEYFKTIKDTIRKVKDQYGSFVYNRETLEQINDLDIHFTINDHLFLEILLTEHAEIRGKTISYASYKKKERDKEEKILSEKNQKLEESISLTEEIL